MVHKARRESTEIDRLHLYGKALIVSVDHQHHRVIYLCTQPTVAVPPLAIDRQADSRCNCIESCHVTRRFVFILSARGECERLRARTIAINQLKGN